MIRHEFASVLRRRSRDPPFAARAHRRADPCKLQRQIAKHGNSLTGMPPVFVSRGSDGELMLSDGVTCATRAAKLCPGSTIPAELLGDLPHPVPGYSKAQRFARLEFNNEGTHHEDVVSVISAGGRESPLCRRCDRRFG